MVRSKKALRNAAQRAGMATAIAALLAGSASAEWTNRYPKVDGYSHHVYLEGYELPLFANGVSDPAAAPDGKRLAIAAKGWLWTLDVATGAARRLTTDAGVDSRPAWSPEGDRLVFVRDSSADTAIFMLDVASGRAEELVNSPAMDLDPVFSADGRSVFYASAEDGDFDIWRIDVATKAKTQVTNLEGMERDPQASPDGARITYLKAQGSRKEIRELALSSKEEKVLLATALAGEMSHAVHPEGRTIVAALPEETSWALRLADINDPNPTFRLTGGEGLPLAPSWSADGSTIYFSEAVGEDRQFSLYAVPAIGGEPREVPVTSWDWGVPTGIVRIETKEGRKTVPARLAVTDGQGHPIASPIGPTHFDPQNGRNFFYSRGVVEIEVPVGEARISAARGLASPAVDVSVAVAAGATSEVEAVLQPLWNARKDGWASADFHFHLNYDGPYDLVPDDLVKVVEGEDLDVATPQLANLHNRPQDGEFQAVELKARDGRIIKFSQEVRPHFHGHTAVIGAKDLFRPTFFGASYPNFGETNFTNAMPLQFARAQDAMSIYVHPISRPDAFSEEGVDAIPLELISDAVLGDLDALEIVCIWSDEIGTAEIWYRLLNVGAMVAPTAGTDAFADFYRTPAIGTTRVYADLGGERFTWPNYRDAVKSGRSFVTSAPMLFFDVAGAGPGDAVAGGEAEWRLSLSSPIAVDKVEILVNGAVVWTGEGVGAGQAREASGRVALPAGGWVAARAVGGKTSWPAMDSYPFAHTAPIWIGEVGSTDPAARKAAAEDLLRALTAAEKRAHDRYKDEDVALLYARFAAARAKLEGMR